MTDSQGSQRRVSRRPKKQHFLPQLHLRHFVGSIPPGKIWTYDILEDQARASLPKETAAQTNFYSITDGTGHHNDVLEHWLAEVESNAVAPYEGLLRGEIPDGEARVNFALFLAAGYARTPSMLRQTGHVLGIGVQMMTRAMAATPETFEASLQEFERDRGPIDPEVRETLYPFVTDPTRYTIEINHEATVSSTLLLAERLTPLLCGMGWAVIGSDDEAFVTGDQPVTTTSYFLNERVLVSFPLSPSRCLVLSWTDDVPGHVIPASSDEVRAYNTQRAYFAERYLYADRQDDVIRELGRQYKGRGLRLKFSGGDKWAPVSVKRRLRRR